MELYGNNAVEEFNLLLSTTDKKIYKCVISDSIREILSGSISKKNKLF